MPARVRVRGAAGKRCWFRESRLADFQKVRHPIKFLCLSLYNISYPFDLSGFCYRVSVMLVFHGAGARLHVGHRFFLTTFFKTET